MALQKFTPAGSRLAGALLESLRPEVEAIIESARRKEDAAEALRRVVGAFKSRQ